MPSSLLVAGGTGMAIAGGVFCRAVFAPRSQICGRTLFRGPKSDAPRIALTFDDGPHPEATPRILDILREHRVPAAFFVVGDHGAVHGDLIRRAHAEGHLIGNHSMSHAYNGLFGRKRYWRRQIEGAADVIQSAIGVRSALFRPPMGFKTFHVTKIARWTGHATVTWSCSGRDGVRTSRDRIVQRLAPRVRARDIVLLHDGAVPPISRNIDATIAALPDLILSWRARGLRIVRLDDLLGVNAYQ